MEGRKDQACAQVYMSRMMKLQQKLHEIGLFASSSSNGDGSIGGAGLMAPCMPQQFIDVGWGEKDTENVALFGNTLPLSRTWEKPNVIFETADGVFYVVLAVDADHHSGSPYLLWARFNVSGDLAFSSGRDLVRWQPPHPPPPPAAADGEAPHHRIFILVFHQPDGPTEPFEGSRIISKNSRETRGGFDLEVFRRDHRLGHLIGANGYRVRVDDAPLVERIVKELRDKVVLDSSGKRVLQEVDGGVVVYAVKDRSGASDVTA